MTIKDLKNNEELVNALVEEIDEVPEDSEVSYEVWAIGYDADDAVTDAEMCVGMFDNAADAIKCAKELTLADIVWQAAEEDDGSEPEDVAYISVEVETVAEDEDGELFNIGTIYNREIWIGAPDPEEADEEVEVVYIVNRSDYEILEDNTLKVSCDLLKGYNKNDTVFICLPHEDNDFVLSYKIMSKVMYEDSDYYHCELTY